MLTQIEVFPDFNTTFYTFERLSLRIYAYNANRNDGEVTQDLYKYCKDVSFDTLNFISRVCLL